MKLYEIREQYLKVLDGLQVDMETGEVLGTEALEKINEDFIDKAENIACYIKNLESDAVALKEEEKRLSERRKTAEKTIDRLKDYLKTNMLLLGKDKIKTIRAEIGFRSSKSVEIDNDFIEWAKKYAEKLLTYKEPEPNKKEIKAALESGIKIEHAIIVENKNLGIK